MTNVWFDRDLPVLKAVVEHVDEHGPMNDISVIQSRTGLDRRDVERALRSLNDSGEFLIKANRSAMRLPDKSIAENWYVHAVTGHAKREAGLWPTPQGIAELLVAHMEKQEEQETDPEKKSRIRDFVGGTGKAGREVAVGVLTAAASGALGL